MTVTLASAVSALPITATVNPSQVGGASVAGSTQPRAEITAPRAGPFNPKTATLSLSAESLLTLQDESNGTAAGDQSKVAPPFAADEDAEGPEGKDAKDGEAEKSEEGESQEKDAEKGPDGLTPGERQQVQELKQRDAEVKRHEQAHANVGGQYASAPTYEYQTGPDGRQYAIGGEVQIDASPLNDPEATIKKLRIVRQAALAPAEPSPQDQRVASEASQGIAQATSELRLEEQQERLDRARVAEKKQTEESEATGDSTDSQDPNNQSDDRGDSRFGASGISPQQASEAFSQAADLAPNSTGPADAINPAEIQQTISRATEPLLV